MNYAVHHVVERHYLSEEVSEIGAGAVAELWRRGVPCVILFPCARPCTTVTACRSCLVDWWRHGLIQLVIEAYGKAKGNTNT